MRKQREAVGIEAVLCLYLYLSVESLRWE